MKAPMPPDEPVRLAALRQYEVLDTMPEAAFDDLTLLASQICQTPIAMIALVDQDRQWFKSRVGITTAETPREVAFCAHAILKPDEVLEVPDTTLDARFADSSLVTSDPHARFYAGAPLITPEGHAIGALCVIDRAPRQLNHEQSTALRVLSRHVVTQLELRRRARELEHEVEERRRSEETVRRSQSFLQSTLDSLSAEIAILDESGVIVAVNAARERFARANPQATGGEGIGMNYLEVCDRVGGEFAKDAAEVARGIRAVIAGEISEFHREYACHNATERQWFTVHVTRFGEEGARRIVVAHESITSLKRAQEEVAGERARFKFIFDSVPIGISFMLPGPNETVLVNPAHHQITGLSASEVLEAGAFDRVTHPDDLVRQRAFTQKYKAGEIDHFTIEKRYLHPAGRIVWANLTRRMFTDPATGEKQSITTLVDITERKEAEQQLERVHRQLLEASRQAGMAEVATSVLHNVGNVLNSVNTSTTLLGERLRKSRSASFAQIVAMLREQQADLPGFFARDPRAGHLIGYLEQLSRHLTADQQAMTAEIENLRRSVDHIKDVVTMQQSYARASGFTECVKAEELVNDVLRMTAGTLDRPEFKVAAEIAEVPPFEVEKHKVLQVLINYVRNARHACDESGQIEKRITLRVAMREDRVVFSVTDNGVGISPENLKRIFSHGFTTRKNGHGFGLHSGANAVREMGGRVGVHSAGLGCGATFTLELPLVRKPPGGAGKSVTEAPFRSTHTP